MEGANACDEPGCDSGCPSRIPHRPSTVALQHPKLQRRRAEVLAVEAALRPSACPDTSVCPPSDRNVTVFIYQGAKEDAAFGNLFYSMAINAALYSWHKQQVLMIKLERSWVKRTMGSAWALNGTGRLWETFFESHCPNVSEWMEACPNVRPSKPKRVSFYYPGVQVCRRRRPAAALRLIT